MKSSDLGMHSLDVYIGLSHLGYTRPSYSVVEEAGVTLQQLNSQADHLMLYKKASSGSGLVSGAGYQCGEPGCCRSDTCWDQFVQHQQTSHAGNQQKCKHCSSILSEHDKMRDHRELHYGTLPHKCRRCKGPFFALQYLRLHSYACRLLSDYVIVRTENPHMRKGGTKAMFMQTTKNQAASITDKEGLQTGWVYSNKEPGALIPGGFQAGSVQSNTEPGALIPGGFQAGSVQSNTEPGLQLGSVHTNKGSAAVPGSSAVSHRGDHVSHTSTASHRPAPSDKATASVATNKHGAADQHTGTIDPVPDGEAEWSDRRSKTVYLGGRQSTSVYLGQISDHCSLQGNVPRETAALASDAVGEMTVDKKQISAAAEDMCMF